MYKIENKIIQFPNVIINPFILQKGLYIQLICLHKYFLVDKTSTEVLISIDFPFSIQYFVCCK